MTFYTQVFRILSTYQVRNLGGGQGSGPLPVLAKERKGPFRSARFISKKDVFLRLKTRGSKNFLKALPPAPIFLRYRENRLHPGPLDFRSSHTKRFPSPFAPFDSTEQYSKIQRP